MNRSTALVSTLAVLGTASLLHATNARVESMGKHDTYFMDDVSVWTNPANANIYPNYLMGELGQMRQNGAVTAQNSFSSSTGSAFARYNQDPQGPWFGAIFAKSFSADPAGGNRYPQIVVGGAFNRNDDLLEFLPSKVVLTSTNKNGSGTSAADTIQLEKPAIKADFLLGFAAPNGVLVGAKLYVAHSDTSSNGSTPIEKTSTLWAGTVGVNAPVAQGLDVEGAFTVAQIDAEATRGAQSYKSNSDLSFVGSARAFISVPEISGELVPAVKFQQIDGPGIENDMRITAGSGVNVSLDRGFFWIGADYSMISTEKRLLSGTVSDWDSVPLTTYDANKVRVSFGIERNVWWDWFVLRVGGQKIFSSDETTSKGVGDAKSVTTTDITTNPEGNGLPEDHVSFGFGLNIEDKLKVDAVVAEDILFTGGNLLGGPADHILSRISATYSF